MRPETATLSADMAFAEFLDWCCGRYAKRPDYRRTLRRELAKRPHPIQLDTRRTSVTADVLTDGDHPHGTIEGFQQGCKSAACPAPVSCRTVHTRYQGDFAFRRQIDEGISAVQIVTAEREAAEAARNRRRTRRSPEGAVLEARRASLAKARAVLAAKRPPAGLPSTPLQADIHGLHQRGHTDREIAATLGKTPEQVRAIRRYMNLPANRTIRTPATAGVSSS